jgi:hypothetical protein
MILVNTESLIRLENKTEDYPGREEDNQTAYAGSHYRALS